MATKWLGQRKITIFCTTVKIDIMKQSPNQRRSRSRGNSNHNTHSGGGRRNSRNHTYESNGPEVKVRGSAQQVLDKYLQLARDCQTGGDRVKAEAYLQFAEHYYRIVSIDQDGDGAKPDRPAPSDRQPSPASSDRQPSRNRSGEGQASSSQASSSGVSPQRGGAEQVASSAPSPVVDANDGQQSKVQQSDGAAERPDASPARGRGRGRKPGAASRPAPKNEATLAAEAAAANEQALKSAVKKPARKPTAKPPVQVSSEQVDHETQGESKPEVVEIKIDKAKTA